MKILNVVKVIGLLFICFGLLSQYINVLFSSNLRNTNDFSSDYHFNIFFTLLGCSIFLFGLFGAVLGYLNSKRTFSGFRKNSLIVLSFSVFFMFIGSSGISLLYFAGSFLKKNVAESILIVSYVFFLILLFAGLICHVVIFLIQMYMKIINLNFQKKISEIIVTPRKLYFSFLAIILFLLTALVARIASSIKNNIPFNWSYHDIYSFMARFWAIFFISSLMIVLVSMIIFLLFIMRTNKNVNGAIRAIPLAWILGILMLIWGIIKMINSISSLDIPKYFRPDGEIAGILLGSGFILFVCSFLCGMKIIDYILTIIGSSGIMLFFVVLLESWFHLDVPHFWGNGLLGIFYPGIVLIIYGLKNISFSSSASD